MKNAQKENDDKFDSLNKRITLLLKEVASLSKGAKRGGRFAATAAADNSNNSGSGTDSPSLQ